MEDKQYQQLVDSFLKLKAVESMLSEMLDELRKANDNLHNMIIKNQK